MVVKDLNEGIDLTVEYPFSCKQIFCMIGLQK